MVAIPPCRHTVHDRCIVAGSPPTRSAAQSLERNPAAHLAIARPPRYASAQQERGATMTTPVIESLEDARRHAARSTCAGCQRSATSTAYEVQKEGPNRGRLFVKCRHCGHFGWLTGPAQRDEELERAQALASPCPRCS